jgi:phospholipid-transporting ATPase
VQGKMLAIGDGANDVAMIQAADVGIGIAGKEGRQAVNNSDYAISQFRFINRLLLVHGQLSCYRLGRLIKYSFYKNSCFAAVLFYFQMYNGFSGQTLVDDISAAVYNVIFTSLPILLFSLLDRPCYSFHTFLKHPRTYNKSLGLSIGIFWKSVLHVRSPCSWQTGLGIRTCDGCSKAFPLLWHLC